MLATDITFCVATTPCPLYTTQDLVSANICNKTSFPATGGSCTSGYTEWLDNECFVNCPSLFVENGLSCVKRTYARDTELPSCSSWYVMDGNTCVLGYGGWLLITLAIFLAVFLLFLAWTYASSSAARNKYDRYGG